MIPITRPELGESEQAAALRAIASGWVSHGPRCAEFESAVADRLGVAHARAVNSCTNAILLTLLSLGIRPGDEVIVPAFTCVAALNPIALLGAVPVPVDIDLQSFGMKLDELNAAITDRTCGVLFAHLFGLSGNVEPVARICARRNLWLIEDIALGFGALSSNRAVGSFGDAAVLSFHPRKLITTGEGGMVATNRADVADKIAALRNYGAARPAWERHHQRLFELPTYSVVGLNCKLTDIQAAIGVEQMKRFDEFIAARAAVAMRYDEAFQSLGWATPVAPLASTSPSWQSYVLVTSSSEVLVVSGDHLSLRDRVFLHLDAHGIAAVQGAQAMHAIDYYHDHYGWSAGAFPCADIADRTTFCLPIFPSLARADQDQVIRAVCSFRP